ncbi:HotDog domain-containing protein [Cokeromyces recurvatus]|uniref:HotDog domain-containing protein n=1 Tax=Cokeromyces recurvatus TaxID=90255 RepID=UPI00221E4986|nr:HotDog domain-containing protein [Cokeromyces recurvatus]KAI7898302.1 HotDog domain-containing protein [Cokeromyces recurvatus]
MSSHKRLSLISNHLRSQQISTKSATKNLYRNRQDYKYFLPIQTRWSDADCYNHINNAIYYHYFDTVINEYLIKHCGLQPGNISNKPIGLVVASQANFYASASYPSIIDAGLSIAKIGNSSVTYRVGIFEKDSPLACVVGGFTHVFVDSVHRKPVQSLPEEFLEGFKKIIDTE